MGKTGSADVPSHSCYRPGLHGNKKPEDPATSGPPRARHGLSPVLCVQRTVTKSQRNAPPQRFSFLLGERQQLAWLGERRARIANPARTRWREARSGQAGNRESDPSDL